MGSYDTKSYWNLKLSHLTSAPPKSAVLSQIKTTPTAHDFDRQNSHTNLPDFKSHFIPNNYPEAQDSRQLKFKNDFLYSMLTLQQQIIDRFTEIFNFSQDRTQIKPDSNKIDSNSLTITEDSNYNSHSTTENTKSKRTTITSNNISLPPKPPTTQISTPIYDSKTILPQNTKTPILVYNNITEDSNTIYNHIPDDKVDNFFTGEIIEDSLNTANPAHDIYPPATQTFSTAEVLANGDAPNISIHRSDQQAHALLGAPLITSNTRDYEDPSISPFVTTCLTTACLVTSKNNENSTDSLDDSQVSDTHNPYLSDDITLDCQLNENHMDFPQMMSNSVLIMDHQKSKDICTNFIQSKYGKDSFRHITAQEFETACATYLYPPGEFQHLPLINNIQTFDDEETETLNPKTFYVDIADNFAAPTEAELAQLHPAMRSLILEFIDLFPNELPSGLPPKRDVQHRIRLTTNVAPNERPLGHCSFETLVAQHKYLTEMLDKDLITRSSSPYAACMHAVAKKSSDEPRMVVDYRKLNELTIADKNPLPLLSILIERMHNAKYFTSVDLRQGIYQIRMRSRDAYKTAFKTYYGSFQHNVMTFGLRNAPATFQSYMQSLFFNQLHRNILVFIDDITCQTHSSNIEDHVIHVRKLFVTLRKYKLYWNWKKCTFAQTQIKFLGFVVSNNKGP